MKALKTEKEYLKAIAEVEKLQTATSAAAKTKLEELYILINEYENGQAFAEMEKLEALREELAGYTEEEIKVFSVMALSIIDYNKKKLAGEDVKFPKFDAEVLAEMREWARLKKEINLLEEKQKQK